MTCLSRRSIRRSSRSGVAPAVFVELRSLVSTTSNSISSSFPGGQRTGSDMSVTIEQARQIVLNGTPEGTHILGETEYQGKFLFLAPNPTDPLEGHLDPFFSVDVATGYFRDFSPPDYDNPGEVIDLLTEGL